MTNKALVALLRAKGKLGRWDRRMHRYYGPPADVNDRVKAFIARGYGAGLVPTFTTNGVHAPESFHKRGAAADLGLRREHIDHGRPSDRGMAMLKKFQRAEFKKFQAGRRRHMQELIAPDNRAVVLRGRATTLVEGSPLETMHDNHVHGAFV